MTAYRQAVLAVPFLIRGMQIRSVESMQTGGSGRMSVFVHIPTFRSRFLRRYYGDGGADGVSVVQVRSPEGLGEGRVTIVGSCDEFARE